MPIAVVGPAAAARQIEAESKGAFSARPVRDLASAQRAIAERDVYAAVVAGRKGGREVLGAGTSLLRDAFYFPEASTAAPVSILAAYCRRRCGRLVALSFLERRRTEKQPSGVAVAAAA